MSQTTQGGPERLKVSISMGKLPIDIEKLRLIAEGDGIAV